MSTKATAQNGVCCKAGWTLEQWAFYKSFFFSTYRLPGTDIIPALLPCAILFVKIKIVSLPGVRFNSTPVKTKVSKWMMPVMLFI
jgi:hypothetical protein